MNVVSPSEIQYLAICTVSVSMAHKIHASRGACEMHVHQFWWAWPFPFQRFCSSFKFTFQTTDYDCTCVHVRLMLHSKLTCKCPHYEYLWVTNQPLVISLAMSFEVRKILLLVWYVKLSVVKCHVTHPSDDESSSLDPRASNKTSSLGSLWPA